MATETTVKGKNLENLIETYAKDIKVSLLPCIGLAEKLKILKHTLLKLKALKNILDSLLGRKVDMILAK